MPILGGPAAEKAIRTNLTVCQWGLLAVAYWGDGAIKSLDMVTAVEHGARIEVICDLMSGACNPKEIRKLRELLGAERVLTRTGLHAKVWITDAGAVLGSSNASTNGLGHENDDLSGLIEANFAIDPSDRAEIAAWKNWYKRQAKKGAVPITDMMLDKADELWRRRPMTRYAGDARLYELELRKLDIRATARWVNDLFVVQKGSHARASWESKAKVHNSYAQKYKELVDNGTLQTEEGRRVLRKNCPFTSMSAAASVVMGRQSTKNGNWKPQAYQT
jgi:hypothetical protein